MTSRLVSMGVSPAPRRPAAGLVSGIMSSTLRAAEAARYRADYLLFGLFPGPAVPVAGGLSGELPRRASAAQPVLGDPDRDLGPGADLQLAPDVLHVRLGGPRRDRQPAGDGLIGQP